MTAPTESAERSDAELITAVRGGDAEAYGELWQRHVDAARRLARQIASSSAEADDLVSESFAKVLSTLQSGGGPDTAFRAYLLTSLRNTFYDKVKRDKRLQLHDDMTTVDPGVPFRDTAIEGLESTLAARAFASLPERWQTVLWHTEIEGESAATVAPLLGLTANGVSALAYRAREGLRQAYLQVHLADTAAESCRSTSERLGAWARKGLSKREMAQVDTHLETCERCKALAAELLDVNHGLRGVIAAIVVGSPWLAGYLGLGGATKAAIGGAAAGGAAAGGTAAAGGAAAGHGAAAGGAAKGGTLARMVPKSGPAKATAAVGGAVVVVAAAAIAAALTLTGHDTPVHHRAAPRPTHVSAAPRPNPPAHHAPSHQSASHHAPAKNHHSAPPVLPPATHPAHRTTPPAPTQAPTVSPSRTPTQSPTASPTPTTPPPTTPAPAAHLTPALAPVGSLVQGRNGVLALTVGNSGPAASGPLSAIVTLPPGVRPGQVDGGWSPAAASGIHPASALPAAAGGTTTRLTGPSIAAGGSTTAYLAVTVSADATVGGEPSATVSGAAGGSTRSSVTSSVGVSHSGLGAEVVTTAHATVTAAGNSLLSCATPWLTCDLTRHRIGEPLINDYWWMQPYDTDSSRQTAASSAATLAVPAGAHITWAGLYWSGTGASPGTALIGRTGSSYTSVPSTRVENVSLHGLPTYQDFANVTATVQSGGTWWVGLPSRPQGGERSYAGWSLVVVAASDALPERQVAVFDGLTPVEPGAPADFAFEGSAAGSGSVSTVAWEGDDGLTGDQVDLDGTPLTPCSGTACDMENSTAQGAVPTCVDATKLDTKMRDTCAMPGWNTFGTDVHTYPVQVAARSRHVLHASTISDVFSLGVVGVALPPG